MFRVISLRPAQRITTSRQLLRSIASTQSRWATSYGLEDAEIEALLSKPSWSVRSLLSTQPEPSSKSTVTKQQLHHLLRLSALPLPKSDEEESKMIKTLESQLHFVRAIQDVDTSGVKPLQSIRDETKEAEKENEITLQSLQFEFDKEESLGRFRRIRRKKNILPATRDAEDWDALAQVPNKAGRYVVVKTGNVSEQ
ncbi:hypothetical protein MMC09_003655 [Bachmanniomyces sp. S44760]|nr:hypothetical protein [Bachmanniomyces sp. S44760]